MTHHGEKAGQLFLAGYNCAQAVMIAFCDVTGFTEEQSARLASSFGGGMGRLREVCGALTGAFLAGGWLLGYAVPGDDGIKKDHYARVQAMAARFRERFGTISCRELLGALADTSPTPSPRTPEYYKTRPCCRFVEGAAEILDEMLAEQAAGQTENGGKTV